MLKKAPIVILNEATTYMDPENETLIKKSIGELTKGKRKSWLPTDFPRGLSGQYKQIFIFLKSFACGKIFITNKLSYSL